jgi:hypothetical protein
MSATAPLPTDPFRTVRWFAGAQLVFATICASLILWPLLRAGSSAGDAAVVLILLAALVASSAALPFALPYDRGEYVRVACMLTFLAAILLMLFTMPLLEAVGLMLGRHALRHPDTSLTATLFAGFLIWPLQFLRPWRARGARAARLLVAGFIAACTILIGRIELRGLPDAGDITVALLAIALTTAVIRLCDAAWSGLAWGGMPDEVSPLREADPKIPAYSGQGGKTVGVALSGGGYRASLFALGALMYIRDATAAAPGRRVVAVCSVSGGSITSAVIAHAGGLDGQECAAFDRAVGELLRHATGPGSMFRGLAARLYYIGLLPATLAAFIGLVWFGLPQIPIATLGRAGCVVAIPVALSAAWSVIFAAAQKAFAKRPGLKELVNLGLVFALLAVLVGPAFAAVDRPEWSRGLAVIAAALAAVAASLYVWSLRGPLVERMVEAALRRVTSATRLSDIPAAPCYILCATEVQQGETAYFAHGAITVPSLGRFALDGLPTARAVRASAAFRLSFPRCCFAGCHGASPGGGIRTPRDGIGTDRTTLCSSTVASGTISPSTGLRGRMRQRRTSWWSSAPHRTGVPAAV